MMNFETVERMEIFVEMDDLRKACQRCAMEYGTDGAGRGKALGYAIQSATYGYGISLELHDLTECATISCQKHEGPADFTTTGIAYRLALVLDEIIRQSYLSNGKDRLKTANDASQIAENIMQHWGSGGYLETIKLVAERRL